MAVKFGYATVRKPRAIAPPLVHLAITAHNGTNAFYGTRRFFASFTSSGHVWIARVDFENLF